MLMVSRRDLELQELELLASDASCSAYAAERRIHEEPDPFRTAFQCDRDRILHCKSFRRLSHKTQVFLAPEGDHYRTRLTHTFEVAQIARSIARSLSLNEDLTEAIALGHDLGHTPFGHCGEKALSKSMAAWRERELGEHSDTPLFQNFNSLDSPGARVICVQLFSPAPSPTASSAMIFISPEGV